jgi:aspartate-semialdehyde dehydrogenase
MEGSRVSGDDGHPIPVGVLGATGLVGQRLVERLAGHPWFRVAEVGASDRSRGHRLSQRVDLDSSVADEVANLPLRSLVGAWSSPLILSALPASVAREVEPRLAEAGHLVVSNASAFRADPGIPLVIPEVNPGHLSLLTPGAGGIVTNPNCAVVPLTMALAPIQKAFGLRSVLVTTFQAVSGAGRPGPGMLELLDNVLPQIGGEEEKIEREPQKILGTPTGDRIEPAAFAVSATSTRVPVLHGHLVDVSVRLSSPATTEQIRESLLDFRGELQDGDLPSLPSLPSQPLHLFEDPMRPQPRLDRDLGEGMVVSVGRLRSCPVMDVRFMVMAHNLERGAAGAALANAELCSVQGLIPS